MAFADVLTVLTHSSGQVLSTVVQTGLGPINAMTHAVGLVAAGTVSLGVVFMQSFLKGLS